MIDIQSLLRLAADLRTFRSSAAGLIIFDGRDRGNYLGSNQEDLFSMLSKADPTGLALGLILSEMVEATISGSKVQLSRVLREGGYLQSLDAIARIEEGVKALVDEPRSRLTARLEESLRAVSQEFGRPDSREVAICLRDAIYSMDKGLKLRWLAYSPDCVKAAHLPIRETVSHWEDIGGFVDALRGELDIGVHLARIGRLHTAIGLKAPGRIAYLSSLRAEGGRMAEARATNYHMAEPFDLDTPVERYPEWIPTRRSGYVSEVRSLSDGRDSECEINNIAQLPRDRLLWLAMVAEMAWQRMAEAGPKDVELTEVLSRACQEIKALKVDKTAEGARLPALLAANWTLAVPDIHEMFESFGFAPWEREFLRPSLDGLSLESFYREGAGIYAMSLEDASLGPWVDSIGTLDAFDFQERNVKMRTVDGTIAGTKEELLQARGEVIKANMLSWIMAWGNRTFHKLYSEAKGQLTERLKANLPMALTLGGVSVRGQGKGTQWLHPLYTQDPKRKTYAPKCFFNGKKTADYIAELTVADSKHLASLLGMQDESELPAFLRGWSRTQSWTTLDRYTENSPCQDRWVFTSEYFNGYNVTYLKFAVHLNPASLPQEVRAHLGLDAGQ